MQFLLNNTYYYAALQYIIYYILYNYSVIESTVCVCVCVCIRGLPSIICVDINFVYFIYI